MNHAEINELLSAYSNGELTATQRDFVDEHLGACEECRIDLESYNRVRDQLTSLRELTVPDSIKEATMTSIGTAAHAGRRTNSMFRPALAAAVLALALIVPLWMVLAGGDSGSAIAKAYAATESLVSYSLEGVTRTEFRGQITEVAFQWDIVDDERSQGRFTTEGAPIEFVIDGATQYSKGVSGGTVIIIDEGNIFTRPIPSRESTLELLDSLLTVEEISEGTSDGTEHLRGTVDMDKLIDDLIAELGPTDFSETFELQRDNEITVDVWIDSDTFFITRLVMDALLVVVSQSSEGPTTVEHQRATTDVRYSNFNQPITLELPFTQSGELEPGWIVVGANSGDSPPPVVEFEVRADP